MFLKVQVMQGWELAKKITTITLNTKTQITMITNQIILEIRLSKELRFLRDPYVCQAEQYMRVNGVTKFARATAVKNGLTVLAMKETGLMTRQMDLASCSTLMVMSTKVSGKMIRQMERGPTLMQMVPDIREIGETTSSMVSVSRHGLTVRSTRDSTVKARKMARESSLSLMVPFIMEISK